MRQSWGFLSGHRMFRAVVSATPGGFIVELFVATDRWGYGLAKTVNEAMSQAVERVAARLEQIRLEQIRKAKKGKKSKTKGV